jgi:heme-degrading monooxygenase HmoA
MYAVLVLYTLPPENRSHVDRLANQSVPFLKALKGFRGATFISDEAANEYGSFSLWDSKENAEASIEAGPPALGRALSRIGGSTPVSRLFEVYEPKV